MIPTVCVGVIPGEGERAPGTEVKAMHLLEMSNKEALPVYSAV